jgi:hypothetical protein
MFYVSYFSAYQLAFQRPPQTTTVNNPCTSAIYNILIALIFAQCERKRKKGSVVAGATLYDKQ